MRTLKTAFIALALMFCWMLNGYADRLYTWTDAQGLTHITQEPPPASAKAVDTIDYSPQPNQSVQKPTEDEPTNQQPENLVQGSEQSGADSGSGLTSGDDTNDIQYEGDSYRRTLLRYEIKHKILDDNEPVKGGALPGKVQPHSRKR